MTNITTTIEGRRFGLSRANDLVAHTVGAANRQLTDIANFGAKNGATVSVQEYGNGIVNRTVFTFTATPITMLDASQGGGVKVYGFPEGRILLLGATGSIAVTTTSALASTLNAGVTGNWGLGTTVQANGTLATTEQNVLQTTAFTASATINVPGAASGGVGAAVLASIDGHTTAADLYLNLAVASATDIDGNATVTVTGTASILWAKVGDY